MSERSGKRAVLVAPHQDIEIWQRPAASPGPGEVLARLELGGVCGTDVHLWHGEVPLPGPIVLGHEGIGVVQELGAGVGSDFAGAPLAPGDRIYWQPTRPCHRCHGCTVLNDVTLCENYFAGVFGSAEGPTAATYSEYVTLAADLPFYRIPDDTPSEPIIAFGCAMPTMLQALERLGEPVEWVPIEPAGSLSLGGALLELQEDGSILATGPSPAADVYHVVARPGRARITALRLEVLPHPDLPASGPGRAKNGNFVLNELTVTAVPLLRPDEARPVVFSRATASFSQDSWDVAGAIDGKPGTGWAVSPRFGEAHVAVFETAEDLAAEGGLLLVARLQQSYGSRHTLGHFRLSATGSARPVRHLVLPGDVLAALTTPPEERTPEQAAALHAHYVPTQPDLVEKIRLGATQDLAWALANNPAFLFNR